MNTFDHMARALAFCRAAKLTPKLIANRGNFTWSDEDVAVEITATDLVRLAGPGIRESIKHAWGSAEWEEYGASIVYDRIEFYALATENQWEEAVRKWEGSQNGKGFPDSGQGQEGVRAFGGLSSSCSEAREG